MRSKNQARVQVTLAYLQVASVLCSVALMFRETRHGNDSLGQAKLKEIKPYLRRWVRRGWAVHFTFLFPGAPIP